MTIAKMFEATDPHEQVPVACARGDVGGDCSVNAGHGRDEGGAEEGMSLWCCSVSVVVTGNPHC